MASLKDMRVRIAATKATQKITKAMQMVAASKLRRAQATAEAARPYAERMDKVLGNIASAATRTICGWSAPPRAACAAPFIPLSCDWRASAPRCWRAKAKR